MRHDARMEQRPDTTCSARRKRLLSCIEPKWSAVANWQYEQRLRKGAADYAVLADELEITRQGRRQNAPTRVFAAPRLSKIRRETVFLKALKYTPSDPDAFLATFGQSARDKPGNVPVYSPIANLPFRE
jgi:hypothetical protein